MVDKENFQQRRQRIQQALTSINASLKFQDSTLASINACLARQDEKLDNLMRKDTPK